MTEQTRDPEPLPERFARDVRRAFANMPYAAHPSVMRGPIAMGSYRDPLTGDDVIAALEALGEVLRQHGKDHKTLEDAHYDLTRDVAAFRRVLGTSEE